MRKVVVFSLLILVGYACKTQKESVKNFQPVSVAQFLEKPFGVEETVASFKKHFGNGIKVKRMIRRNKFDAQKVDTIVQFYHRKSEVFIYKTYFNREMLLGGVIYDSKFPLVNGVKTGVDRNGFFKSFNDLPVNSKDSVEISNKESTRKFIFIFDSKGELKKISFSSYVD